MSVINLKDLQSFNFKNYGTFLKYNLFDVVFELSKSYSLIEPIPEASIKIYSRAANFGDIMKSTNKAAALAELLQCGTKPLDAIVLLRVIEKTMDDPMIKCFTLHHAEPLEDNQFRAIAVLTASVIVFISRGGFPSGDGKRKDTPLPNIVDSMIKGDNVPKTEGQLLESLCSFDTRHISTKNIFTLEALRGWDAVIVNRLNLGVAGHKTLKLAYDMSNMMTKAQGSFTALLVDLYTKAEGGFYPKLHPSDASFSIEFKGFYAQSLAAIFDDMTVAQEEKVLRLSKHPAFQNEKLFKPAPNTTKINLDLVPRSYRTWDLGKMKLSIGQSMKFEAGDHHHTEPLKVEGSQRKEKKEVSVSSSGKVKKTGIVDDI